jgi:uncharacterized protein YdeI (BOF family)
MLLLGGVLFAQQDPSAGQNSTANANAETVNQSASQNQNAAADQSADQSADQEQTTDNSAAQAVNPVSFAGGGYTGNVLAPITVADLANAKPNEYVIVDGYVTLRRVPGAFVLADDPANPKASVIVYANGYDWANLQIDSKSEVLVYGIVSKSEMDTTIYASRFEIKK